MNFAGTISVMTFVTYNIFWQRAKKLHCSLNIFKNEYLKYAF